MSVARQGVSAIMFRGGCVQAWLMEASCGRKYSHLAVNGRRPPSSKVRYSPVLPLISRFIPFYSWYACLYSIARCTYMPSKCVVVLVGKCGRFGGEMSVLMETASGI